MYWTVVLYDYSDTSCFLGFGITHYYFLALAELFGLLTFTTV